MSLQVADFSKSFGQELLSGEEEIISLSHTASIVDALKILAEKNIMSCPVVDANKNNECIGFIDLLDVLGVILDQVKADSSIDVGLIAFAELEKVVGERKVGDIVTKSNRNPFHPVQSSAGIWVVLELLGKTGIRRVPIVDAKGKIRKILTQSAVVGYLAAAMKSGKTPENLKKVLSSTIKSLGIGAKHELIVADMEAPVIDAFRSMSQHNVHAVPVVDGEELVGTLSVKDLRVLLHKDLDLSLLKHTALEFLQKVHEHDKDIHHPAVSCSESATLKDVVLKLHAARMHRTWVVGENRKPIGVVALREVCLALSYPDRQPSPADPTRKLTK